jgi:hypothetical protein
LLPTGFTYNTMNVVISADKESQLYVENRDSLGHYNPSNGYNNIQTIQTPMIPSNNPTPGYWASPAYWFDGTHYWLYYSATMNAAALLCNGVSCQNGFGPPKVSPEAINAYRLQTSGIPGPIPSVTPYANSGTSNAYPILFCDYAPTPSVSSNGNTAGSGIVWAIEMNQNNDNNPNKQGSNPQDCAGSQPPGHPAALHAFCAAAGGPGCPNALTELYNSRTVQTSISKANGFPTPTVFEGQVYMGTNGRVNVFGLCSSQNGGCLN